MSQQIPPNSFLASDGNVYSNDGKYTFANGQWVQRQSASGTSALSLQSLQPQQSQPEPRASYTHTTSYQHPGRPLSPISGNDMATAMCAQFELNHSSTTHLPQQQSTSGTYSATGEAAVPAIDVDPSVRAAAGRHPMIGAFVEALDALSARGA